jgi:hypothetical protein
MRFVVGGSCDSDIEAWTELRLSNACEIILRPAGFAAGLES